MSSNPWVRTAQCDTAIEHGTRWRDGRLGTTCQLASLATRPSRHDAAVVATPRCQFGMAVQVDTTAADNLTSHHHEDPSSRCGTIFRTAAATRPCSLADRRGASGGHDREHNTRNSHRSRQQPNRSPARRQQRHDDLSAMERHDSSVDTTTEAQPLQLASDLRESLPARQARNPKSSLVFVRPTYRR